MRPFFNLRWLLLSLFVVAILAMVGGGVWWWINRPENLFASAQKYYARAEAARARGDEATAKSYYEYADKQLQNLLHANKAPNHSQGWMLRNRVLTQLTLFLLKEEEAQATSTGQQRVSELGREADWAVERAALLDPKNAAAQATTMMKHLKTDSVVGAERFATNLVKLQPGENSDGDWPTYHANQSTAHYVLAWMALQHSTLPRPLETLEHLRAAAVHGLSDWQEQPESVRQEKSLPLPRWRMLALEGKALLLQAEQASQVTGPGGRPNPEKAKEAQECLDQLRAKLPGWLARARAEIQGDLPPKGVVPMPPTVASMAVVPSPSDTPAVLDVLILAVGQAMKPQQVLERTDLALAVCEKMVSAEAPPERVIREVYQHAAQLPDLAARRISYLSRVERQPGINLARSPIWEGLRARIDRFGILALERNAPVDPEAFLRLARNAHREGRRDSAWRYIEKGIEVMDRLKRSFAGANDPRLREEVAKTDLGLHATAAWLLLVQHKVKEAETHLAVLRSSANQTFAAEAYLMDGLMAVQEGRLEQGVKALETARQYPVYADSLYPYVGLAYGYMGLGRYDRALVSLERMQLFFQKYDQLSDEERAIADLLVPNPIALHLECLRCHLALGNLRQALEYKELLLDVPEGLTAQALLVDYYLARAQVARNNERALALEAARMELEVGQKAAPRDPRFAWAEASLLLAQPASNAALVASAVAALVSPPANLAVHVVENLRLRKGIVWHQEKAESVIRTYATSVNTLDARLAWVRWLILTGRFGEASGLLSRLEVDHPDNKRILQCYRAELLLKRGESQEVTKLLKALETDKQDLQSDLLSVRFYAELGGDLAAAERKLKAALTREESNGQLHYVQASLALAQGDYRQAAQGYLRSLEFASFKSASQRGLLTSLLGLAGKESAAVANELAADMLRSHPNDPALLLAYAETAVVLDNVYGEQGMEGALNALEGVLREQLLNAAIGPYFQARGWTTAGRPDLARREVARALQADPNHVDSLILAGQLALAQEDWAECLQYAAALKAIQPELVEGDRWQAVALENLGRTTEAEDLYEELVSRFPDQSLGYMGLAGIHERAQDSAGALQWIARWRKRAPQDLDALQKQVALLTRAGREQEVSELFEQMLQSRRQPSPSGADGQVPPVQELAVTLAVAHGFQGAEAFDQADAWGRRALALVDRLPEASRVNGLITVQLALGEINLLHSQQQLWPFFRDFYATRAIEAYQAVYEKVPGHLVAGNNLAWLLVQERGETEAALAVIQRVRQGRYSGKPISGERLSLDVLDTLGIVYREAQQYEEAVRLFRDAARRYPDDPRITLHLARSFAGLQSYRANALEYFNRAARLAAEKAESAVDPQRKAQWLALAAEARQDQQNLLASR